MIQKPKYTQKGYVDNMSEAYDLDEKLHEDPEKARGIYQHKTNKEAFVDCQNPAHASAARRMDFEKVADLEDHQRSDGLGKRLSSQQESEIEAVEKARKRDITEYYEENGDDVDRQEIESIHAKYDDHIKKIKG